MSQRALEALQGRVTVLEGRVKFMENQASAAAQEQAPLLALPPPSQPGWANGAAAAAAHTAQRAGTSLHARAPGAQLRTSQHTEGLGGVRLAGVHAATRARSPAHASATGGWGSSWRSGGAAGVTDDGPLISSGMNAVQAPMDAARAAARGAGAALARSEAALSPARVRPVPGGGLIAAAASYGGDMAASGGLAGQPTQDLIRSLASRYSQAQAVLQEHLAGRHG